MPTNFLIFLIFSIILIIAISEALTIYITQEKGKELWKGVFLGFFPIIGQLIASLMKASNLNLINEMYDRNLIAKNEYEKTMEMEVKNK